MKTKKIKSITSVGVGDVYDISVEKYENYILENGVVTHNSGLQYAASTIIYLSKSKEKDGTEIIGNIIRAKTQKSRLSKENQQVEIRVFCLWPGRCAIWLSPFHLGTALRERW